MQKDNKFNDKKFNKIVNIIENSENVETDFYLGDPNGIYDYVQGSDVLLTGNFDELDTDGEILESATSFCEVDDSNFVIIKNFVDAEMKKVSVVLSHEMYGYLNSLLLSSEDYGEIFNKLNNNIIKKSLDEYECNKNCYFSILPKHAKKAVARSIGSR